jgi:hypothetical protein
MNESSNQNDRTINSETTKDTPLIEQQTITDSERSQHPISLEVSNYIQAMRGIALTAQTVLPHSSKWLISEIDKAEKRVAKFFPGFPKATKNMKWKLSQPETSLSSQTQ